MIIFLVLILTSCSPSSVELPDGIWVADGYTVEKVAGPDLTSYPMFATTDHEGRLFVFESTGPNTMSTEEMLENPSYRISILKDLTGDGIYDESKIFADNLPLPQGGVYYQGSLYVSASPDLLRLTDTTGDGVADDREVILTGWVLNVNACTLQGPFFGPDGWLYMPDCRRGFSIETKEGELLEGNGARIWRVRPDGTGLEWISGGGFDNAVELAFMPAGEVIGTMTYFTDPQHGQRDALMHWVEGGVYPKPHSVIEEDELIRTGDLMPTMTKLPRVAPSGIHRYRGIGDDSELKNNLFSVHFNTGRVIRSKISRDGATFTTEDEEFFYSNTPRFHPTDILEDADGSLLLLDTGGWFVQGCPLSGGAKEEARGGIYRIKEVNARTIRDPGGQELQLETLPPAELIRFFDDARPVVRDRTIELLVEAGQNSIAPLAETLNHAVDAEVRISAVFALYRIGTPEAQVAVRNALRDSDFQVRVAAARSAGMARDEQAVDQLMDLVINDEPAVRRQAATALGQIGDERATSTLLTASTNADDRFVEHAIIHSLITLENPEPVVQALNHESVNVQKASLITLDQMKSAELQSQQVVSLLESDENEIRRTALWIASRHPEWSSEILGYLQDQLEGGDMTEEQEDSVGDVLVSFCDDEQVQGLMARILQNEGTTDQRKLYLMNTIDRCNAEIIQDIVHQVGDLLINENSEIQSRAIALIRSRGFSELTGQLEAVANDQSQPTTLRISAIGAMVSEFPQLSDDHFAFMIDKLEPVNDASIRQSAARVLGQSELDNEQLLHLATNYLPRMEPSLLSRLVDAYNQPNQSSEVGQALIASISETPENLDIFSDTDLEKLFSEYPADVQDSSKELIENLRLRHESRLQRLEEIESGLGQGDVGRGRDIFFGNKAICSTCHTVGEDGDYFGPDLTNIGEIRSRHDILESIFFSNVNFAREYETYRIETESGTHTGIISEETSTAIIMNVAPGNSIRISREEIVSMEQLPTSMMPSGLANSLTTEELTDLIAFLEALPYRLDRLMEQADSN